MSKSTLRTPRTNFFLGGNKKRAEIEEVLAQPECSCPDCSCVACSCTVTHNCPDPECGLDYQVYTSNRTVYNNNSTTNSSAQYTTQGGTNYAGSAIYHTLGYVVPWGG
jgi:hypothetical protein